MLSSFDLKGPGYLQEIADVQFYFRPILNESD